MDAALWDLLLTLQNEYAYGNTPNISDIPSVVLPTVTPACAYIERIRDARPLGNILVIGPGGTMEPEALRKVLPQHTVIVTLTPHAPEAAFLREHGYVSEQGDIHDMPFVSEVFDFVYAANVLEHTLAPYAALLDCRRVLGEGKIAYFVVPWFAGNDGGVGPFHLHCLTPEVWRELLRKTGFVLVDIINHPAPDGVHGYAHYICTTGVPPKPHDKLLNEIITYKAARRR